MLAAAKSEAEAVLRQAHEEAGRIEQEGVAEIETRSAALVAESEARLQEELATIRASGSRDAALFDAVDERVVRSLVRGVMSLLLDESSPPAGAP
jgi:vacuolar-type H+-ATPase subunit H